MLDKLTAASFSAHLHTKFRVYPHASQAVELELAEVTERPSSPRQVQFSVFFLGPKESFLPQGMYRFEHDGMGALEGLFLVPVAAEPAGYRYEAVFNLLIPKGE